MNSENSQGYCVPTDSSANEVIAGLARAAAVKDIGASSNHTVAIAVGSAVGGAVLLLIVLAIGISVVVRRRRKERGLGSAELASLRSLPMVRPAKSAPQSLLCLCMTSLVVRSPAEMCVLCRSCAVAPQRIPARPVDCGCAYASRPLSCRSSPWSSLWDAELLLCCAACSRERHQCKVIACNGLKRRLRTSRLSRTSCSTAACAGWGRWTRSRWRLGPCWDEAALAASTKVPTCTKPHPLVIVRAVPGA